MSRLRLVTLATLTPEPELELVARDRRADRLAEQLGLDAVRVERIDQRAAAGLDLGLVDRLLRRPVEVVGRRQHPLATLRARAELELGLLGQARIDRCPGGGSVRGGLGFARCSAGSSQSSSSAASYNVGIGSSPEPWRSLLSVDMLPNAVRARRPIGMATAPTPLPVCDSTDRNDAPRQQQGTADARRDQHDDGAAGGDQVAQRLADQRTDPATGATRACRSWP